MNVIYLVVLFSIGSNYPSATIIPQNSAKQCEQNSKYFNSKSEVKESYCIWGVK